MSDKTYEIRHFPLGTLEAGEDLSEKLFHGVKVENNGNVIASGEGEYCLGILQGQPKQGEQCDVECLGISKAKYGADVIAGQKLMTNSESKFVPHTGTFDVAAIALTSGTANDLGTVLVIK